MKTNKEARGKYLPGTELLVKYVIKEAIAVGMETNSSKPLLESAGWLAAHRRNRVNPVRPRLCNFTRSISLKSTDPRKLTRWPAWSIHLHKKPPTRA